MPTKNVDNLFIGEADLYLNDEIVGYLEPDSLTHSISQDVADFLSGGGGDPLMLVRRVKIKEAFSISGKIAQVQAVTISKLLGKSGAFTSIKYVGVDTLAFGGGMSMGNSWRVDVVGTFPANANNVDREFRIKMYCGVPKGGLEFFLHPENWTNFPFQFDALVDSTKAAGEQFGEIQIERTTES